MATNQSSIATIQTNDRLINQLQSSIQQALQPMLTNPIVYGVTLKDIELAIGPNTIPTGLGRALQGWIIVLQNAVSDIYDLQSTNSNTQNLILNSSAIVTVSIYVF